MNKRLPGNPLLKIFGGLLLGLFILGGGPSRSAAAEVIVIMGGTPYETTGYICRGNGPGRAALVLGGVHGNEPAGWQAAERLRDLRPDQGLLLVIPQVNKRAVNAGERTLADIGDVNRAYPGSAAGTPAEQLAGEIVALLEKYQVSVFIDLHEAEDFHRRNPASLGQSLEFAENDASALLAMDAIAVINRQISDPECQFTFLAHPVAGSGANYAGRQYGLAAFTVETASLQPLEQRINQHCLVVRALLQAAGLVNGQ